MLLITEDQRVIDDLTLNFPEFNVMYTEVRKLNMYRAEESHVGCWKLLIY